MKTRFDGGFWIGASGQAFSPVEMTTDHLLNTVKMLKNRPAVVVSMIVRDIEATPDCCPFDPFGVGHFGMVKQSLFTAVTPDVTLEPVEIPLVEEPAEPEPVLLGSFRITAYCSCEKCCGEWAKNRPNGIVYGAAGVELKAGVSCASPLPLGTVVEVEGLGEYIVQDRPAQWVIDKYGENQIDIYFDNHEAASAFGLKQLNVYLKGEPEK